MYDRFDVEQDRPGLRVGEQEVQHVAEIDIRHVAARNDVAEADAAVRRPVQHGGDHHDGLAADSDVAGSRLVVADAGNEGETWPTAVAGSRAAHPPTLRPG